MDLPPPNTLVSDLDGTFLPIPGEAAHHDALRDLGALFAAPRRRLIYASGRHLASIQEAIGRYPLPAPDWIIADVGVSLHAADGSGGFTRIEAYEDALLDSLEGVLPAQTHEHFASLPGLRRQAEGFQSRFKLSYECAPEALEALTEMIGEILQTRGLPMACTSSMDPEAARGLIDVLPAAANKFTALRWLAGYAGFALDEVVYAGDSGNDYSALSSGLRAILVANATPSLGEAVTRALEARGQVDRLYQAVTEATCGVLEGCHHFGLHAVARA